MPRVLIAAWIIAAFLAGCSDETALNSPPVSARGLTVVSPAGLMMVSGLKRVQVRLTPSAQLPVPAFLNAQVEAGGSLLTMGADTFGADGLGRTPITTPLMPGDPVTVFLRDANGRLLGSGSQTVTSASSELSVPILANVNTAAIIRSLDANSVADKVVIRVSPLEMSSGYMDAQPGVDHVDIEVSGLAYGDGREVAKLGTLQAPNLASYQWQPSLSAGTFDPEKLAEPGTPQPFYVTTRAYDMHGNEVGVDALKIAIVGTAFVTVGLDDK